jgi:hypothetical protein
LLIIFLKPQKVGEKLKAAAFKIIDPPSRLEGDKNTDCACKSVIFAHRKLFIHPEKISSWPSSEKDMPNVRHHHILWPSLVFL